MFTGELRFYYTRRMAQLAGTRIISARLKSVQGDFSPVDVMPTVTAANVIVGRLRLIHEHSFLADVQKSGPRTLCS